MKGSGQVRPRQEGDSARGLALLDSETRKTLRRRRWRQPPLTRPALALALTLVLVLHVLFALALWYEMQPRPSHLALVTIDSDQALIVRLINHSSKPRAAQPPEPPALPERPVPPRQALTARVGRANSRSKPCTGGIRGHAVSHEFVRARRFGATTVHDGRALGNSKCQC
jgi:hypothetical protein